MTTIHILANISRSKCKKTMKFVQLIYYNKRNIFLQKSCKKWERETSSRPFFIFGKDLYMIKATGLLLGVEKTLEIVSPFVWLFKKNVYVMFY